MKKFTSKLFACASAVLAFFAASPTQAQVASAADLYGTYEFTATLEVTDDGQEYKDLFSDKCDVKIEAHSVNDLMIVGLGGSTIAEGQPCNYSNGNIRVMNPNGSTYYYWGKPVVLGNNEGGSPFDGSGWELNYTVDLNTKTITLQDFTAITVDAAWNTDKILAKFTNCKLTFKEATVVELQDISGEYQFKAPAGQYNAESSFPVEFDMTLTATSALYNSYKVTIDYGEGFVPVDVNATFDGTNLNLEVNDTYLNEEKTYAFCDYYNPSSLKSTIVFKYVSEKALTLSSGIHIVKVVEKEGTPTLESEQYYTTGSATKATEGLSFVGKYVVTCDGVYKFFEDAEGNNTDVYNVEYPTSFEFEIFRHDNNQKLYVSTFMDGNIFSNTNGYYPCEEDGNTLRIPVGDGVSVRKIFVNDDFSLMVYDVLYNGLGENTGTIELTLNDDGTVTMGDFFLTRKTTENFGTPTFESAAYYGYLKVEKKVEKVITPEDFIGKYSVTSAEVTKYLDGDTYNVEYPTSFEFEIFQSDYNQKLYVSTFMDGNIYNNTNGYYPCEVEGNTLRMPVGDAVSVRKIFVNDDFSLMVYDVLYNGSGENTGTIELTLNDDGTVTMGDFHFMRKTTENFGTPTFEKSAKYSSIAVEKKVEKVITPEDFIGKYSVTSAEVTKYLDGDTYNVEYPTSFEFEIFQSDYNQKLYVSTFMDGNIYNNTNGYYPCEVEGNTLRMPVGDAVSVRKIFVNDDFSLMVYDVLYNGSGENTGTIELTLNDDGTVTMGDFHFMRKTTENFGTPTFEKSAKYSSIVVEKKQNDDDAIDFVDVDESTVKVYAANGTIYVAGEAEEVKVYSMSGACVFNGVTNQVSGLNKGLYIVKCGNTTVKVIL